MNGKKQISSLISKRRVRRFAALLLLFYLIADVTVLEYFCGNPDLGIVSYTQAVAKASMKSKADKRVFIQSPTDSSKHDSESNTEPDGDDCFCCCSHALQSVFIVENRLPVIEEQIQNSFTRKMQSNPHLTLSYRPPRIA